ncbi:hypothetical protein CPB83DRAFT_808388, partial [Crepidotus variabilis]
KKARVSAKSKAVDLGSHDKSDKPKSWKDIQLDGEDEVNFDRLSVSDDCAEIRRKIRLLQKTPDWKVTHWLKEIGCIDNNSSKRFSTSSFILSHGSERIVAVEPRSRNDGATNGTYYAAYVYFEKVRILEGEKKTSKRIENESIHPNGFPLVNPPKYVWARR